MDRELFRLGLGGHLERERVPQGGWCDVGAGQGLLFVKLGDELPGGYIVADVQENMVTLKDSSGGERTLRLR